MVRTKVVGRKWLGLHVALKAAAGQATLSAHASTAPGKKPLLRRQADERIAHPNNFALLSDWMGLLPSENSFFLRKCVQIAKVQSPEWMFRERAEVAVYCRAWRD